MLKALKFKPGTIHIVPRESAVWIITEDNVFPEVVHEAQMPPELKTVAAWNMIVHADERNRGDKE